MGARAEYLIKLTLEKIKTLLIWKGNTYGISFKFPSSQRNQADDGNSAGKPVESGDVKKLRPNQTTTEGVQLDVEAVS
jgi:hypothetical protein